jgi:ribonuclease HI
VGVEEKDSDVRIQESVIFKVYTDGSGMTGGPAGIGFVAYVDDELLFRGSLPVASATNHQAELRAAAFALDSIPEGQDVELVSDSEYVVNGFTEYLPKWRERGWRTSGGGSVANLTLWEQLIVAVERHRSVRFKWTKGHDGTEGNEHAHRLASEARRAAEELDSLDVVPPEPPALP